MRAKLFDWHLTLGTGAGLLIFIWALSGATMTLEPLFLRGVQRQMPKLSSMSLRTADFRLSPATLPLKDASAFAAREFDGKAWYELTSPDGSVHAFDARTGAPVATTISPESVLRDLHAKLKDTRWTPRTATLLEKHTDVYRKGRLPVYEVALDGPDSVILFVFARDGAVEKTSTRWSRLTRWLGLGVHTWNFQAVMDGHDDARSVLLSGLVALPLAAMGAISYALLMLRRRSPARKATSALAAVLCAALLLPSPSLAATISTRIMSVPGGLVTGLRSGIGRVFGGASRDGSTLSAPAALDAASSWGPDSASASPLVMSPAVVPHAIATSDSVSPLQTATPNGTGSLPTSAAAAEGFISAANSLPAGHPESGERSATRSGQLFDSGALVAATTDDSVDAAGHASEPAQALMPAAAAAAALVGSRVPRPSRPTHGRDALLAIFLTHAGYTLSMVVLWRIAWPLFVLSEVGKKGLGVVVSLDQLTDIALGVVAGIVVDRLSPSRSMAASALVRAAVGVVIAATALWWKPGALFLLGLAMVHVFANTVIYLGQGAVSPAAASGNKEKILKLNVVLKLITTAIGIPGAYFGGWLVDKIGIPLSFVAYATFNALVLAPMYAVMLPKSASQFVRKSRSGLRDILRFILSNRTILALFLATGAAMTFAEPLRNTILPILAKELLRGGALLLGHLMTAFYTGQTLGVLALWRWSGKMAPRYWIGLSALGLSSFWFLTLAPKYPAFLYVAVAAMSFFTQPAATMIKTLLEWEVNNHRKDLLGQTQGLHLMFYAIVVGAETALLGWAFSALAGSFLAPILPLAIAYSTLAVLVMLLVSTILKKSAMK